MEGTPHGSPVVLGGRPPLLVELKPLKPPREDARPLAHGVSCSALPCAGGDRPAEMEPGIEGAESGGGRLACIEPVEDDDEFEDEDEDEEEAF